MANDITSSNNAENCLISHPVTVIKSERNSEGVCSKTVELHLSPHDLETLLKEKAERESDEVFQITEEPSKDIEHPYYIKTSIKDTENTSNSQLSAPSVTPVMKRKRGRPRKEENLLTLGLSKSTSGIVNNLREKRKDIISPNSVDEEDTDNEIKSKRSRKLKILHDDYVADFNTSDEEEDGKILQQLSGRSRGRGRGRGRGRRRSCEFPEAFNDFFTTCSEILGTKPEAEKEFVDHGVLKDLFDYDEEQNIRESKSSPRHKQERTDGLEGVIGPGGQTRVQIVNTGDITVIDEEENYIYNIITTTGDRESITPILIPKVTNIVKKKEDAGPSLSPVKMGNDNDGNRDSITQWEDVESETVSKETQNMEQQIDRSLYRQVESLKQKYYQALQELKKKPEVSTFADLVYNAARLLTDDQLVFFTMQLKSGYHYVPAIKYNTSEKMLALAFYLQNPDLYKWLCILFNLPSKVILERWLDGITRKNPDDAKKLVYEVYTRYIFRM